MMIEDKGFDGNEDIEIASRSVDNDENDSRSMETKESVEENRERLRKMMHMILGMGSDGKTMEKFCCVFRINKKQPLVRQLTLQFSLFLTIFMVIISGVLTFFVKFCPTYVGDSVINVVDSATRQNFIHSTTEYSTQVQHYFESYENWLIFLGKLLSTHAGWNDHLYDSPSKILLQPKKRYFDILEETPSDLVSERFSNTKLFPNNITLNSFSYIAFHLEDRTGSGLSDSTKAVLDSVDIISYFFKDFFFDPEISYLTSLFIYTEARSTVSFFPGGCVKTEKPMEIQTKSRPWYIETVKVFNEVQIGNPLAISGPYLDQFTSQKTLTFSLPIVQLSYPTVISAIINVDIIVSNFQSLYKESTIGSAVMRIALVQVSSGLVANDCFESRSLIQFNDTQVTGFTDSNWNDIITSPEKSVIIVKNFNQTIYYVSRSMVQSMETSTNNKFMVIAFGKQDDFLSYRYKIEGLIDSRLIEFWKTTLISISTIWVFGYVYIYFVVKWIVKPLHLLSSIAKQFNKGQERQNSNQQVKNELDRIQASDPNIIKLIQSFKNLVDKPQGLRKIAVQSINHYLVQPTNPGILGPAGQFFSTSHQMIPQEVGFHNQKYNSKYFPSNEYQGSLRMERTFIKNNLRNFLSKTIGNERNSVDCYSEEFRNLDLSQNFSGNELDEGYNYKEDNVGIVDSERSTCRCCEDTSQMSKLNNSIATGLKSDIPCWLKKAIGIISVQQMESLEEKKRPGMLLDLFLSKNQTSPF